MKYKPEVSFFEDEPNLRPLIMWALTYQCNLRCHYCYLFTAENISSVKQLSAPPEIVENIADSLTKKEGWQPEIIWLTGGEPTLHSQLFWLIEKFESSGTMVVVTTNGVISTETAYSLIKSKPRGIMVSLDSFDTLENDRLRSGGDRVLDTIDLIAKQKDSYTTLGVATVITKQNRGKLCEFAKSLQQLGVEYLSINPLDVRNLPVSIISECEDHNGNEEIENEFLKITNNTSLLLPSSKYVGLLGDYFHGRLPKEYICPAAYEYAFIAPWGQVYPCSNEFWYRDPRMTSAPVAGSRDFVEILSELQILLNDERFTTYSMCYSTRCMGCWKLYYDSTFVRR